MNQLEEKAAGLDKESHRLFLLMKNAYNPSRLLAEQGLGPTEIVTQDFMLALKKLVCCMRGKGKEKETLEIIAKLINTTMQ
jgi:hypothetical protein